MLITFVRNACCMNFAIIPAQKATIHQVMTMLTTSKYVLFPGHNHQLIIGTDDPSIKVSGDQYWWLAGGYDLEVDRIFSEVASMVVTLWTVWVFFCQCIVIP